MPEMREAINTKFKAVVAQIDELKAYIQKEDKAADVVDARLEKINQVRDAISAIKNVEKIDREVVQRYIDRIIVNMDGTLDVIMHYDKTYSVAVPNVERPHLLEGVGNNPMRGMNEW